MSSNTIDSTTAIRGAGLGLRRALLEQLMTLEPSALDFLELAPENWINVGGRFAKQLNALSERFPFVCHGLSLSLGSPAPLDFRLLTAIKGFLKHYRVRYYTEHLSYCSDHAHLYELFPIPFTHEAVQHVAGRIRQVQDFLEQRIAIENVSYYCAPGQELREIDFINAVVAEADCDLLLDVNNIYVNSINHAYDPFDFLRQMPGKRSVYFHVAGHFKEAEDLRVDSHGAAVIDPVWDLLTAAYERFGPQATLLERDFNFPPMAELLAELQHIRCLQGDATAVQCRGVS